MVDNEVAGAGDGPVPARPKGYVLDLPDKQYFSHPALSASQMKLLLRSPKQYQWERLQPPPPKDPFDVGTAIHSRVLGSGPQVELIDPDLLSSDGGIRSTAAKQERDRIRAEGKIPMKQADYNHVMAASDAVLMNPKARRLLELGGDNEVSLFGEDQETGVALRSRLDRCSPEHGLIVDLKSARSIALRSMIRDVNDYHYDLSAEVYRYLFELLFGRPADAMHHIWMEKEPPYDVRVVKLGLPWQDGGWAKMRAAIAVYVAAVESGVWPGVDELDGPVEELEAPGWYVQRAEASLLGTID